MKKRYNIAFVVLVYRNIQDLEDFFLYNKVEDSITIVVNSFYDDETENKFKQIAENHGADFLSVPNNGYGAGNNKGIDYVLSNYNFDYLIISNADIMIDNLMIDNLRLYTKSIIAPKIISVDGKLQNPCSPFKPLRLEMYLRYQAYKRKCRKTMLLFYAFSRIKKIVFHLTYPIKKKIFAAHGAFVIIPKAILLQLLPLYNEKMFLFGEETHLALKAEQYKIPTFYVPQVVVRHKEDGSMKVASINIFEKERDSFIELYNFWYKKNPPQK